MTTALATLTQDKLKEILDYSIESGIFKWKATGPGRRLSLEAGSIDKHGYMQIRIDYKIYFSHRLAWLWVHGQMPSGVIDHIDGNPLNNSINNIRDVSRKTNQENQRSAPISNKSTGLLGVSFNLATGKYLSKIQSQKKQIYLGLYATPEEAHAAYLTAKRNIHKGCTI